MFWLDWWERVSADTETFKGRKGANLLKLLAGVMVTGVALGKRDISLSARQGGEVAGMSKTRPGT